MVPSPVAGVIGEHVVSEGDTVEVGALIAHVPEPHLMPREVGRAVGNVANDRPELIDPV